MNKEKFRRVLEIGMLVMFVLPMFGITIAPTVVSTVDIGFSCFIPADAIEIESVEGTLTDADISTLSPVQPWWVDMVDAHDLDYDGEDVYIAVLDTGLRSNWKTYFNESNIATEYGKGFTHDITWDDEEDEFVLSDLKTDRGFITSDIGSGHGTHVTSTIIGYRAWSLWANGVAPKVKIIPVLVLDTWLVECPQYATNEYFQSYGPYGGYIRLNGGSDAMVAAGIDYITDLAEDELEDRKIIISMSLGGPEKMPIIEKAINNAIDEGIIVVASAGNNGEDGMGWPGAYHQVISVGAAGWTDMYGHYFWGDVPEDLNTEDKYGNAWQIMIMPFSSRPNKELGQKTKALDLCDPGWPILGPYQVRTWWNGEVWLKHNDVYHDGYYWWLSGTSMAAPHCSGIAALVLDWAMDWEEDDDDDDEEDDDDDDDDGLDIEQKEMEKVLKIGARKNWPEASYNSAVFGGDPSDPWYKFEWERKDWGKGLLQADEALNAAEKYFEDDD